jgi:hypothetical protein
MTVLTSAAKPGRGCSIHHLRPSPVLGKPIWILSEGVIPTDNQSQFISDTFSGAKTYNLQGVFYFNGPGWTLDSSAISTLCTALQ